MHRIRWCLRLFSSLSGLVLTFALILFAVRELGLVLAVLLAVYVAPGGALVGFLTGEFLLYMAFKERRSVRDS